MRLIALIAILALFFSGAAAVAHGYGSFANADVTSSAMKMPCCPSSHQKPDALACHYCCVALIAVMPVSKPVFLPFHPVFPEAGEDRMASFSNHYLFKPPRSFS